MYWKRVSGRTDSVPTAIDTNQLPSTAKQTIVVTNRASIIHTTALIIDLDLALMNDHPLFTFLADHSIGIIPIALATFKVLVAYQNISASDAYRVLVAYQNIYGSSTISYWTKMLENILYVEETKITARKYRHRTTVPAKIFKLLELRNGDILRWIAMKDGRILIEKKFTK